MDFDFATLQATAPWFFQVLAFLFGACVGSFLNVVIYRIPKGESVVYPGSHCGCGQPIAWYDNIPILSWLLLRGRARCCGRPFSFRYPAIELLTAALFVLCWNRSPQSPAVAVCGALFLSCLIAATFIDLDHMIIPNRFTIGLAIVGLVLSCLVPALHGQSHEVFAVASLRAGVTSLIGILVGSSLVLWIAIIAEEILQKEAMGFGDVKFVGAIGAFCGWQGAIFAIFGGAIVGTIWFATAKLIELASGRRATPTPEDIEPESFDLAAGHGGLGFGVQVPFGPMLAIAGAAYFLFGQELLGRWFAEMAPLF